MNIRNLRGLILTGVLALAGPAAHAAERVAAAAAATDTIANAVYYSIRPDLRRCVAPLCGGYFVKPVNRRAMRCADGVRRSECYVADISWDLIALVGDPGAALVLAQHRRRNFPGFGRLGILLPRAAWRAAAVDPVLDDDGHPAGRWFGLRSTGLQCFAAPCYNIEERVLNRRNAQLVSGVDLSRVVADEYDHDVALRLLHNDELLAVGNNARVRREGPAGDGLRMVANDFFLPIKAPDEDPLYCEVDSDCTLSVYHSSVTSKDECYCPLCPQPIGARAAKENQASWARHCADIGVSLNDDGSATLLCPQVLCTAPAPVQCVGNQCVSRQPWPPILQSLPR